MDIRRYFMYLSYDGSRYHGWQIQNYDVSVQQKLQEAISILLRQPIEIVGAGRTDAGVHAYNMVAHFDAPAELDCLQLAYKLNRLLPADIAVKEIKQVASHMHARFSAISRTYHYYIHTHKDPFLRHYSWEVLYQLDFEIMNVAAHWLLSQEDFASFCKVGSDVKMTLCHVNEAQWVQLSATSWRFEITANRFLRNMVRAVVGTLIEVGRHRASLSDFQKIVSSHCRSAAGESVPAHALFLFDVRYPSE